MTITAPPPKTTEPPRPSRPRWRVVAIIAAAALAAGGMSAGLALSFGGSSTPTTGSSSSAYDYYQSMMGRYGIGSMMGGGSYGLMMGRSGYSWMMGGLAAPGWMNGASLPGFMMGSSTDPGKLVGQLFADAPGPRVSPATATALGNQVPAGASIDGAANRVNFSGHTVSFAVIASPAGNPGETFRVTGLVNPTIDVPESAQVTVELINADPDTAHGLIVTASGGASSWMPMMTSSPAFAGSALWFLGNPTTAGMHQGTLSFTADQPRDTTDTLGSLSVDHRRMIVELFYRQRSVAETAKVLGIPEGTVRSRCFYALRALGAALENKGLTRP